MGKIRVKTIGDETLEREQAQHAKKRREEKAAKKTHVKGVGLKGGQQLKVMEGVELKPEVEALLKSQPGEQVEPSDSTEDKPKKARKVKIRVRSKRYRQLAALVDPTKLYDLKTAIELVKKTAKTSFDGSVETHVNLNPATLPKDQKTLSGVVNLPYGTGKKRIITIADDTVIERVKDGKIDFDILVAHPSMMPKLARVARILGPKGLMPNPKNGTVTTDPEKRVKELGLGEINWKTEPDQPVIHQVIGKVSFPPENLQENITEFVKAIGTGKIAKLTLSSSMGPGIKVDISTI